MFIAISIVFGVLLLVASFMWGYCRGEADGYFEAIRDFFPQTHV